MTTCRQRRVCESEERNLSLLNYLQLQPTNLTQDNHKLHSRKSPIQTAVGKSGGAFLQNVVVSASDDEDSGDFEVLKLKMLPGLSITRDERSDTEESDVLLDHPVDCTGGLVDGAKVWLDLDSEGDSRSSAEDGNVDGVGAARAARTRSLCRYVLRSVHRPIDPPELLPDENSIDAWDDELPETSRLPLYRIPKVFTSLQPVSQGSIQRPAKRPASQPSLSTARRSSYLLLRNMSKVTTLGKGSASNRRSIHFDADDGEPSANVVQDSPLDGRLLHRMPRVFRSQPSEVASGSFQCRRRPASQPQSLVMRIHSYARLENYPDVVASEEGSTPYSLHTSSSAQPSSTSSPWESVGEPENWEHDYTSMLAVQSVVELSLEASSSFSGGSVSTPDSLEVPSLRERGAQDEEEILVSVSSSTCSADHEVPVLLCDKSPDQEVPACLYAGARGPDAGSCFKLEDMFSWPWTPTVLTSWKEIARRNDPGVERGVLLYERAALSGNDPLLSSCGALPDLSDQPLLPGAWADCSDVDKVISLHSPKLDDIFKDVIGDGLELFGDALDPRGVAPDASHSSTQAGVPATTDAHHQVADLTAMDPMSSGAREESMYGVSQEGDERSKREALLEGRQPASLPRPSSHRSGEPVSERDLRRDPPASPRGSPERSPKGSLLQKRTDVPPLAEQGSRATSAASSPGFRERSPQRDLLGDPPPSPSDVFSSWAEDVDPSVRGLNLTTETAEFTDPPSSAELPAGLQEEGAYTTGASKTTVLEEDNFEDCLSQVKEDETTSDAVQEDSPTNTTMEEFSQNSNRIEPVRQGRSSSSSPSRDMDALYLTQSVVVKRTTNSGKRKRQLQEWSSKQARRDWDEWYEQYRNVVAIGRKKKMKLTSPDSKKNPSQSPRGFPSPKTPPHRDQEVPHKQVTEPPTSNDTQAQAQGCLDDSETAPVLQRRPLFKWNAMEPSVKEADQAIVNEYQQDTETVRKLRSSHITPEKRSTIRLGLSKRSRPPSLHKRLQWWVTTQTRSLCSLQ